ncbi:MAG: YhbY family RNA-binding protein [Ruminococcus sp.]|nr:YhbY family RNA-binding protein [Ruminococcus sp.]
MLTNKQRAELRGMANSIDTILQIGKGGITETVVIQAQDALRARELIKVKVLDTAPYSTRDTADALAEETESEVVQVIGGKFVLYKRNLKDPVIILKK